MIAPRMEYGQMVNICLVLGQENLVFFKELSVSSPARLDLGEYCKTFTNIHLNSSWLWGIQPHS